MNWVFRNEIEVKARLDLEFFCFSSQVGLILHIYSPYHDIEPSDKIENGLKNGNDNENRKNFIDKVFSNEKDPQEFE